MAVFRIEDGSDVPIYRQLVQQVRRDVMLGRLRPGDQLPSVKDVVDALSVNPNTVVKAFGELEHQGVLVRRQGVGTFVAAAPPLASLAVAPKLQSALARWVDRARADGLSAEQIRMLLEVALDEPAAGQAGRAAAGGAA
ncbi:MAG TPA: GntR family transcriptional regulator [Trebonia sp.]